MRRRQRVRPRRVLHVPYNIGGNASGLSDALRGLGWASTVWTLLRDPYGFPADRVWWNSSTPHAVREVRRLIAIVRAALFFDVIHYNFGTTIAQPPIRQWSEGGVISRAAARCLTRYRIGLQHVELWLMKRLGRRVFVHYQGDDARLGSYQASSRVSLRGVNPEAYTAQMDEGRRRQIELIARYAECVYAVNPDLLNALSSSARFLPYSHVDPRRVEYLGPEVRQERPLVIGHAPTDRRIKGTEFVVAAVEALREHGVPVELKLIEGLSHDDAMAAYRDVDVLIDQLFAGWYGGLAVELMAMGKPVLAYIRNEDLHWIPAQMASQIPVVSVTAESLERVILELTKMPRSAIAQLGVESRHYVETWHDPRRIAEAVAAEYRVALGR